MRIPQAHHGASTGIGAQGTLGGVAKAVGTKPGRTQIRIGDEGYLWILIALELFVIGWARQAFRRDHGG